jgi:hypothetical protein
LKLWIFSSAVCASEIFCKPHCVDLLSLLLCLFKRFLATKSNTTCLPFPSSSTVLSYEVCLSFFDENFLLPAVEYPIASDDSGGRTSAPQSVGGAVLEDESGTSGIREEFLLGDRFGLTDQCCLEYSRTKEKGLGLLTPLRRRVPTLCCSWKDWDVAEGGVSCVTGGALFPEGVDGSGAVDEKEPLGLGCVVLLFSFTSTGWRFSSRS